MNLFGFYLSTRRRDGLSKITFITDIVCEVFIYPAGEDSRLRRDPNPVSSMTLVERLWIRPYSNCISYLRRMFVCRGIVELGADGEWIFTAIDVKDRAAFQRARAGSLLEVSVPFDASHWRQFSFGSDRDEKIGKFIFQCSVLCFGCGAQNESEADCQEKC